MPLTYFIDQPFQNWTRRDTTLLGAVTLFLDHEVRISDLRAEAKRVTEQSDLWDRGVFVLQVTDFTNTEVEVRVLASASSAGRAFDLRCELREGLLAYLQNEQPRALPKTRIDPLSSRRASTEASQPPGTEDWRKTQDAPEAALSELVDPPDKA